VQQTKNNITNF